jgi:enoyl-CoA hydratase/carnithine racemase
MLAGYPILQISLYSLVFTPTETTHMNVPGTNPDRILLTVKDGIADVRLTREDKRNALDSEMFSSIAAMGEHISTLDNVRVVVLSGNGASFCAGLDFASFHAMAAGGSATGFKKDGQFNAGSISDDGLTHLAQKICWIWQQIPVPVIAAIHGHALGGGIQLALGSDIRFVHPDTHLSVREIYWGIIPDMTGTLTLSRLVRPDIAKELVFTGKIIDGREAFAIGLHAAIERIELWVPAIRSSVDVGCLGIALTLDALGIAVGFGDDHFLLLVGIGLDLFRHHLIIDEDTTTRLCHFIVLTHYFILVTFIY